MAFIGYHEEPATAGTVMSSRAAAAANAIAARTCSFGEGRKLSDDLGDTVARSEDDAQQEANG